MAEELGHPSAFDLDRYSAEELSPAERMGIDDHLAHCATCRAQADAREARRAELLSRLPAGAFVSRVVAAAGRAEVRSGSAPSPSRRFPPLTWRAALAFALGCAAVALLVWRLAPLRPDEMRAMGADLEVTAHLKRGGTLTRSNGDASVRPGDALRFELRLPRAGFLAIWFMDEDGALSWVVPAADSRAARPVSAGELLVPGSVTFDASPLDDRAFVVVRERPFDPLELAAKVAAAWKGAPPEARGGTAWLPRDTVNWSAVFHKQ